MFSDNSGIKLEINNKDICNIAIIWKLNNPLLNNLQINEEVTKIKYFELNKNESTAYQSLWNAAQIVVQREMFSVTKCLYLKRKKIPKLSDLSLHLKKIEDEEQIKPNASRRKETIIIRVIIKKENGGENQCK